MAKQQDARAGAVDPRLTYRWTEFMRASGLGHRSLREARRVHGLEPATFVIGRNKYVDGSEAIRFMRELSATKAAAKGAADSEGAA